MDSKPRGYLAELIGVFLVVFVGAGTVCGDAYLRETGDPLRPNLWGIALAEAFALTAVLAVVYRESPGCLNPAVTLTLWVCKRLGRRQTAILIGAQLLGSFLAGLAVRVLFPENVLLLGRVGAPHLGTALAGESAAVGLAAGLGTEALLTFFLTLVIFGTLIDPRGARFGTLGIGLARGAIVLVGWSLTGGSANPARWFGPALWQLSVAPLQQLSPLYDNPVYWAGPVAGALLGGYLYARIFLPPAGGAGAKR